MNNYDHGGAFVDYYALLDVDRSAESGTIRAHYVRLAKKLHPDTGGDTEAMQLLNLAYQTLTGPLSRAAYDKLHALHTMSGEELFFRDETDQHRSTAAVEDAYIDMYVDALYTEYYDSPKQRPGFKRTVSAMVRKAVGRTTRKPKNI